MLTSKQYINVLILCEASTSVKVLFTLKLLVWITNPHAPSGIAQGQQDTAL